MRIRHFIAALATASIACLAQEKRLYINMETLFEGYYKTVAANLSFEDRKQEVEDQFELFRKEVETIQNEGKKYEADYRNELLAKSAREAAARKLQAIFERLAAKKQEYEQKKADNAQMLQKIRLEREEELVKEILKVANAVADEKGCTELVEVSGKTFNRIGVFLRYPKTKDITDDVLKRINQGHEEELKTSKEALEKRRSKDAAPTVPAATDKPAIPAAK